MFFKRLMMVALAVGACSKPAMEIKPVNLLIGGTSCTSGAFAKLQAFFQGAPNASEIHTVWTCAHNIVSDFNTIAAGASPDKYTKEELRGFLVRYFFPEGISDNVLSATMRLKQFLVGGDTENVSRDEIARIMVDLDKLDALTASLAPSTAVVFGKSNAKVAGAEWMRAYQSLTSNLDQLAGLFAASHETYAFSEIAGLLIAWADELDLPNDSIVRRAAGLMPAVGTAKSVLIGGSSFMITSSEWHPLIAQIGAAYADFRMVSRLLDQNSNDQIMALGRPEVQSTVTNVIDVIDQSVAAHPAGKIPLDDIRTLLAALKNSGYVEMKYSVDQIMEVVQFALSRLFGDGSAVDSINAGQVAEARKLLARWQVLESALETGNQESVPEFDLALRPDPVKNPGWILRFDVDGRVQIPAAGPNRLNREMSLLFAGVEWLGNRWSTWPLSGDAFQAVVKDVLAVLKDLGITLKNEDKMAAKLLMEANLFMPGGNGDTNLDLAEVFQYGVFALSAYHGSHQLTRTATECKETDYACLRAHLFDHRQTLLSNFSLLGNWLNAHPDVWPAFSANVVATVGDQTFEQFMVLHYIETFMQHWDLNQNGTINVEEAKTSFSLFQPTLDTLLVSRGFSEDQILPFYTFLFKYGAAPDPLSWSHGLLQWEHWRFFPGSWAFDADRSTFASILAQLTQFE